MLKMVQFFEIRAASLHSIIAMPYKRVLQVEMTTWSKFGIIMRVK